MRACLIANQAEDGCQNEKNDTELLLDHVTAPDQRGSLRQQVYSKLTVSLLAREPDGFRR
jgi:hypothetical protein